MNAKTDTAARAAFLAMNPDPIMYALRTAKPAAKPEPKPRRPIGPDPSGYWGSRRVFI